MGGIFFSSRIRLGSELTKMLFIVCESVISPHIMLKNVPLLSVAELRQ